MRNLLKRIFTVNDFDRIREWETVDFYRNRNVERKEFYLLEVLSIDDLIGWKISDNSPLDVFDELRANDSEIEKNTSLILAVKVRNFQTDLPLIKNKILLIEEDAYYFKKYVIVYTDDSIHVLLQSNDILRSLKETLFNSTSFVAFKRQMTADEQYFVTMQLFLKLPFLPTPIDRNVELTSIEALLENRLTAEERILLNKLTELGNPDTLNWLEIRGKVLSPNANEEDILQFISNF